MSVGAEEVLTREFQADHASFVVSCPSPRVRDTIERAFVDLPHARGSEPVVIELRREAEDTFSVLVGDEVRFSAQRGNQALGSVVTTVTRIALDADPDRLHLHCAALAKDGQGVLVTARSGTGKTTLATKLLMRGWSYGSDEAVAIDPDSTTVTAFPKPLMIKDGAAGPVSEVASKRVVLDRDDDRIWTVPASAIAASAFGSTEPELVVVLVPDYGDAAGSRAAQPTPIHPTDAVVAMMQQTMDASRFGIGAIEVLAGLAARSRCVQMPVGPLDAAAHAMDALLERGPTASVAKCLTTTTPLDGLPWHVSEHARSVLIDDRAVVHDTIGGAVSAFDEAGTAVWLTLLGEPPDGWSPEMLRHRAMLGFVEQLVGLGFVHAGDRHSMAP